MDRPSLKTATSASAQAARWIIDQAWEDFSDHDHHTWAILYDRQLARIYEDLVPEFAAGLDAIELPYDQIPNFRALNKRLKEATGWKVVAVPGLIPERDFFSLLAQRMFPAGNFIRKRTELDYIEAPDVFHDVFGHVPLLANPAFAAVTQRIGVLGRDSRTDRELEAITRLYWFTVEFGLVRNDKGLQAYGAGIASSPAELQYALRSYRPRRAMFDLRRVTRTPYRYDAVQPLYFVVPSFHWLLDQLSTVDVEV